MLREERQLMTLIRLAPSIRDHKDLETKLTSAPPHLRGVIYETVKPHLKFKARSLESYVISAGQMAERQQLPVLKADGTLTEFRPAQDLASAQKSIAADLALRTLTLVCSKCTREDKFYAVGQETNVDVVMKARSDGWIHDFTHEPPREICPNCPTSLRTDRIDA